MRNLYLVGMMGSGKSTLGRALAGRLGRPFIDSDALVARRAGQPISQIFVEAGEAYFRELERHCLHELAGQSGLTVALGGGTFLSPNNRKLIVDSGLSIYLRVRPETIWARLGQTSGRPLLAGTNETERRQLIEQMLAEREPVYRQADLIMDNDGTLETSLEEILAALDRRGWR